MGAQGVIMRAVCLGVSAMALAACAGGEEPRADREVTVVAEPLRFLSEENVIEAIGTARAARSARAGGARADRRAASSTRRRARRW